MRNTMTEYSPTLSWSSRTKNPPQTSVAVKPTRIATRMSGENADESRMAAALAIRYWSLSNVIRSVSRSSAVKALMVAMPPRLFASCELIAAACSRTAS